MPSRSKSGQAPLFMRGLGFLIAGFIVVMVPLLVALNGYKGDVLIAPESPGSPFDKALILITQHGVDGAMGVVLNKPLSTEQQAQLSKFIRDAGIPVGYGGPLGFPELLFVLEEKSPETPGVVSFQLRRWDDAIRQDPDLISHILEDMKNGRQKHRLFIGYAGWGPFQLESEILIRRLWQTISSGHDLVFQNGDTVNWEALRSREDVRKRKEKKHNS